MIYRITNDIIKRYKLLVIYYKKCYGKTGKKMILRILMHNYLIGVAVISWISAQLLKTFLFYVSNKKMDLKRLSGAGGMPSAHSALVSSVAVGAAQEYGLSSPYFSLAFTMAVIVLYDAMGVRHAAGNQAKAINSIREYLKKNESKLAYDDKFFKTAEKNLNESLGHTPCEVLAGVALGACVAVVLSIWLH